MNFNKLKSFLQQIDRNTVQEEDILEMVHLSRSIVQVYLRNLRYTIVKLCAEHGLSDTDLAYDCIAEAFSRNQSGEFVLLRNFVASLDGEMESLGEQDVFIAFKSFLLRITDAQLSRMYSQVDPMGSKIHRNLRECLKVSNIFFVKKDFRGLVIYPDGNEPLDQLEAYPLDILQNDFLSAAKREHSTNQLIKVLHDTLVGQSRYRRSIPLMDVVQLFKKIYQLEYEYENSDETLTPAILHSVDTERIRFEVENALKEKIVLTYFAKGKVDRKQAEALWLACKDMITDWCKPESEGLTLFGYFSRYYPIDADAYESTYRVKMEYLLKSARKEFAERLKSDL
jgi:hypothetical protein